MKWTQDRPTESGDYWFRRTENKVRQVVRVQGDRVIFLSGKTKDISHLQGEWGGPVTSSSVSVTSESPKTNSWFARIGTYIVTLLLGGIAGALINEPYFSYGGAEKVQEIVQELGTAPHKISFKVFPIFRNGGLKPGHIEDVKFSPRELESYPEDVKLNYCDKAPISLLSVFSGKTVICNFVATIDPRKTYKHQIYFQASYYGPGGHEIHTETYKAIPQYQPVENQGRK
jgi:hypothetical protein